MFGNVNHGEQRDTASPQAIAVGVIQQVMSLRDDGGAPLFDGCLVVGYRHSRIVGGNPMKVVVSHGDIAMLTGMATVYGTMAAVKEASNRGAN